MGCAPVSGLDTHIGYWLRFVSNHVSHSFRRKLEARGVTVAEWVVLRELFEAKTMFPSELANRLGMTRGAISKLVDRLADKLLVVKAAGEKDRRFQAIQLTGKGKSLVPTLAELADLNDEEFFGHLTAEERERLIGLMTDIVHKHALRGVPTD